MKVLKRARQQNFVVDKEWYTTAQLRLMLVTGIAFYINDASLSDLENWLSSDVDEWDGREIRIPADICEKIEVKYVDEELYVPVVTLNMSAIKYEEHREIVVRLN